MAAQWETLMRQIKDLRGESNGLLYRRTVLLCKVFDDGEYLAFHGGDLEKAETFLDAQVADVGLSFFDVRAMLKTFPNKRQWEDGKLREMLAEALERSEQELRDRSAEPVITRARVTRKEFEEVQEQRDRALARAETYLEPEIDKLRAKVAELTDENRRLVKELANAEGRISELERFVSRKREETSAR